MHSIFIVDDHPVIRFGMRKVLEDAGYQIAGETDNGADAIQMVRETDPDLLLPIFRCRAWMAWSCWHACAP